MRYAVAWILGSIKGISDFVKLNPSSDSSSNPSIFETMSFNNIVASPFFTTDGHMGPSKMSGGTYTNPYGNLSVIDAAPEDMLDLVSPHWYSFPPMNVMWYGLISTFLGLCFILAITGNLIVIYIFSCTKSLRTPSNYFVVNLAISDFILMSVMAPPVFVNSYYQTWVFGPFFCQIYGIIGSLTGCTSIYTMCCISYDRYNVIVKGLSAKPLTMSKAILEILGVWLASGAWTVAPLFGWGRYAPEGNMTACGTDYLNTDWMTWSYVFAYSGFCYFLPLLFIIYCYWYIVAAVTAHEKQMKEQAKKMGVKSLRSDAESAKKSGECKLAKVALVTVSLWFMAWTPYLIINMAGLFYRSIVTPLFSIWGSVFAKANTVYNPIVYAISHPKYKAVLHKKMPWLSCQTDSLQDDATSTASTLTTQEENKV